jgi:C-terminal lipocalin-like domain
LTMLMVAGCFLTGCGPTRPVTRDVVVGGYTYVSNDPENRPRDHEWDRLTLQADGKYDLVQGGPTKVKSEKTGTWTFTGGDPAQVMLDHAGYPVRVKSGEVRLMIDFDTGIWYAKTK